MVGGNNINTKSLLHFNVLPLVDNAIGAVDTHSWVGAGTGKTPTSYTATIETTIKKYGDGSGMFVSASSQSVTFADSDDWNFGSGNFTIRFWVRFATDPASGFAALIAQSSSGDYNQIMAYYYNNALYFVAGKTGFTAWCINVIGDWNPSADTWYHLEFVRGGSTFYIFVDGTALSLSGTQPSTNTVGNVSSAMYLGKRNLGGSEGYLNGYLDDVEIAKGIARHTSNFTPPTESITPDEYTVLHCPMDSSFNGNPRTPTINTSVKKLGAGSLRINSLDNQYITCDDSDDFYFGESGNNKVSIGFWIRFADVTGNQAIYSQQVDVSNRVLVFYGVGYMQLYISSIVWSSHYELNFDCAFSPSVDTWYHIYLAYDGDTDDCYIAIDGDMKALSLTSVEGAALTNLAAAPRIGNQEGTYQGNFYIDEFRIQFGSLTWTEDFTPPTDEYSQYEGNWMGINF